VITETKVRFDPAEKDTLLDARVICERAAITFDQKARLTTEQDDREHFVKKTKQAQKAFLAINDLMENT
jgi:hypothetical protein